MGRLDGVSERFSAQIAEYLLGTRFSKFLIYNDISERFSLFICVIITCLPIYF